MCELNRPRQLKTRTCEMTVTTDDAPELPDDERREARNGQFRKELEGLISRYSKENGSDTPDFILAGYLTGCLDAFDSALTAREVWYGRKVGDWNTA